ncbi:Putative methyltransferase-like protein C27D7.08c [Wickerhamiella sorbophila]|uniref:Methyltransferase-like protein C27D7.08c n=1 Tax=Wickerhamiella sorbophila TaxID=45607 RepID=A0A2T0FKE2_9ASCO|nr:Putative methyltransferase-like protein C27D7.08c [Wickerhamiella sorbophila]PRT55445.1 Putative methyltransferase-like protein C27D7.08c [Wickerhamiella sorbophila]
MLSSLGRLDWGTLLKKSPRLKIYFAGGKFNFESQEALRLLVETQLELYCGLKIALSPGFLVPRLANRLDYLLWIKQLTGENSAGIDLGVGGNCIYPLLGSLIGLTMVGVDIDPEAIEASKTISKQAGLDIDLRLVDANQMAGVASQISPRPKFLICNPPFFADSSDRAEKPPRTLVARDSELYTSGGELEFAQKLFASSRSAGLEWTSIMLGKKSSLEPLIDHIVANNAHHAVHVIAHGKTRRWVVAWSFSERAPDALGRSCRVQRKLNPPKTQRVLRTTLEFVESTLENLEGSVQKGDLIVYHAPGIVWSRAYRRSQRLLGSPAAIEFQQINDGQISMKLVTGDIAAFNSLVTFLERAINQ